MVEPLRRQVFHGDLSWMQDVPREMKHSLSQISQGNYETEIRRRKSYRIHTPLEQRNDQNGDSLEVLYLFGISGWAHRQTDKHSLAPNNGNPGTGAFYAIAC